MFPRGPRKWKSQFLLVVALLGMTACGGGGGGGSANEGGGGATAPGTPLISSIAPTQGVTGTAVTLTGTGLRDTLFVTFSGSAALVGEVSDTSVTATVPYFFAVPTGAKTIELSTLNSARATAPQPFTVVSPVPKIRTVIPDSGAVGTQVFIFGSDMVSPRSVTFGGVAGSIDASLTGGLITTFVPPGAATGSIQVVTASGTATSPQVFTVPVAQPQPPVIASLVWPTGVPGTVVTLLGSGLSGATSVTFGGVPAQTFSLVTDRALNATVPATAVTGPVVVTNGAGTAQSPLPFTVLPPSIGAPVISTFIPASSSSSPFFSITGENLASVTKVQIAGKELSGYQDSDTAMHYFFPLGVQPVSGPITAISPFGTFTTPTSYAYVVPPPTVTRVSPPQAAVGTPVAITGTNLRLTSSVSFGGVATTGIIDPTSSRIRVQVPVGARSGLVSVTTPGGTAQAPGTFRVLTQGASTTLGIDKAYITQGIQDGAVPLVAGKPGVCRVFVTATGPNTYTPTVRVTLQSSTGATLITQDVKGPSTFVPTDLDEDSLGGWNLPVAGNLIQPGMALLAEILPDPSLPVATGTYPASGTPQLLNVVQVQPMAITLIPIQTHAVAGGAAVTGNVNLNGRTLNSWAERMAKVWPLSAFDLQVADPWDSGAVINNDPANQDFSNILIDLELKHRATPGDQLRAYYGVYQRPSESGLYGRAFVGVPGATQLRTGIGHDGADEEDGFTYSQSMAHEMGHIKGRRHAPCGGATNPDPNFPFPPAGLGGPAFDVANMAALDSTVYNCLMGYCSPTWVSAYTYTGILGFLQADAAGTTITTQAKPVPQDCLMVMGRIHGGVVTLDPAFEIQGYPDPAQSGPYTLSFLDAQGKTLMNAPFAPANVADGDDGDPTFILSVPMTPALKADLASIQVGAGARSLAAAFTKASLGASAPRDPSAVRWTEGRVRVGWDAGAYPKVMVRDPRTGAILATGQSGAAEIVTDAPALDVIQSDGVRTTTRRVPVGD